MSNEIYGTTHYPHGWLGVNSEWRGICPTIDAGIWKHHTLLIEIKKLDKEQVKQYARNNSYW